MMVWLVPVFSLWSWAVVHLWGRRRQQWAIALAIAGLALSPLVFAELVAGFLLMLGFAFFASQKR